MKALVELLALEHLRDRVLRQIHVGFERYRVISLRQRVQQFVHGNRLLVMKALVELLALEHLRDRVLRRQTYEILGRELREPPAVEVDHRFFRAENFEDLCLVGLGVLRNLLRGQRRPRCRAARWIAYHSSEISDEEDDRVSEILKMFKLAQQHRVAEVQIGGGWIEARLYPERLARCEGAF